MASPQLIKLIEAVRDLGLEIVVREGVENVRISGGAKTFPGKLVALQRSLEEYDAREGESEAVQMAYNFLLKATYSLARKVSHLTDDGRSPAAIINSAIRQYSSEPWAGELSPPSAPDEDMPGQKGITGLEEALRASSAFRNISLEKAQRDIQRRLEEGEQMDNAADPGPDIAQRRMR